MSVSTAFAPSRRGRGLAIETKYKNFRDGAAGFKPQDIALIGQGSTGVTYSTTPIMVTSSIDVAKIYGFGSPLHLAARQLFPDFGTGVGSIPVTIYPLVDAQSSAAGTATVTATGTASKQLVIKGNISGVDIPDIVIGVGADATAVGNVINSAINATLNSPVTSANTDGVVTLTSKAKGTYANDLKATFTVSDASAGVTLATTAFANGAGDAAINDALSEMKEEWHSIAVICCGAENTNYMDAMEEYGNGRWGAEVHKPIVSFYGTVSTDLNATKTFCDGRKADEVNSMIPVPGSVSHPMMIAAATAREVAIRADSDPAFDYGRLELSGIEPGKKSEQLSSSERDIYVKFGCSTTELRNGVVCLSDTITFSHPDGVMDPEKRYIVDIMKLMTIIYNVNAEFSSAEWDGAPMVPDIQPISNGNAKKPKMVKSAMAGILDYLGVNAIISDTKAAKASILVEIDDSNPKRWNMSFDPQLSGNSNVKSITMNYGYYYGQPTIVG